MKYLLVILIVLVSFSGLAQQTETHQHHPVTPAGCAQKIDVTVNGLVCDFCARALEKVFMKHSSVANIKVDLDNALVSIGLKPTQSLSNEAIGQMITDSGYNLVDIKQGCARG